MSCAPSTGKCSLPLGKRHVYQQDVAHLQMQALKIDEGKECPTLSILGKDKMSANNTLEYKKGVYSL